MSPSTQLIHPDDLLTDEEMLLRYLNDLLASEEGGTENSSLRSPLLTANSTQLETN